MSDLEDLTDCWVEVYVGLTVRVPIRESVDRALNLANRVADALDAYPLPPEWEAAGVKFSAPTGLESSIVDAAGNVLREA